MTGFVSWSSILKLLTSKDMNSNRSIARGLSGVARTSRCCALVSCTARWCLPGTFQVSSGPPNVVSLLMHLHPLFDDEAVCFLRSDVSSIAVVMLLLMIVSMMMPILHTNGKVSQYFRSRLWCTMIHHSARQHPRVYEERIL